MLIRGGARVHHDPGPFCPPPRVLLPVQSAPDLPPAANHDTPCIVTVRLWEFRDPSRELRRELLVLPRVVLCRWGEAGVGAAHAGSAAWWACRRGVGLARRLARGHRVERLRDRKEGAPGVWEVAKGLGSGGLQVVLQRHLKPPSVSA